MTTHASRREFLRRSAALAAAGAASPWALNLAAMSAASAQAAAGDYRALVCVFLYGGNDNHNTVVPLDDASHAAYAGIRTGIALTQAELAATELVPANAWPDSRRMALHPALAPLKPLFDGGQLALAMNVGTLLGPTTLADYRAGIGLPPKLFSHNDQQSFWQAGGSEGTVTGWGGRIADQMLQGNGAAGMFTSISAAGNAVFMSGRNVVQYQVSPAGSIQVATVFGSDAATQAIKRVMQQPSLNLFAQAHAAVARRSIAADLQVRAALAGVPSFAFPADNPLAAQLGIVARLIAARAALGLTRQVFFVSLGGFDMHDNLIAQHPVQLGLVAAAMKAFYDATVTMGVADSVTTFTGSDFGRTLASNGDGSDHGWGSYHFVMGNAVNGGRWVGQLPAVAVNGPNDVGSGRLLPAIGVDPYGATLAKWLGVRANSMADVFPNIGRFASADLGFMRAA
jgi:uncharacterized protein (DUF1501 family)